jgi:hypothetical protein
MPADFMITFILPGYSGTRLDIRPEVTKSTMASHRLRLCNGIAPLAAVCGEDGVSSNP